ncbi:MAG: hypothetical protein J0L52_09230 [Caulobacterales bacterium]|nr:hypothetical protein [Caulobacterales bacterium]
MMLALILITAVLVCVGASAMADGNRWRRWGLVAATATTGALVWVGMAVAPHQIDGPYERLRISLEAMSLPLEDGAVYRLGGDATSDDIVVAPRAGVRIGRGVLPPGVLEMQVRDGRVELRLGNQPNVGSHGVVRIRPGDGPESWLAATVTDADEACVAQCGSASATFTELEAGRAYFAHATPTRGGDADRSASALVFTDSDGQAFALADDTSDVAVLNPGDNPLQIDILEADQGLPPAGEFEGEPGRLTLRRTFLVHVESNRLILTPQTPQSVSIDPAGDHDRSVLRIAPESEIPPEGAAERVIGFSMLGQSFSHDLAGVVIDAARMSDQVSLVYNQGGGRQAFQQRTEIGAGRIAMISVRPLDFRGGVYPFAPLITTFALVAFALGTWRIRLSDPLAGVAFATVELVLVMRLLVAMEGAFVDAAVKAETSVADALIAIPLGLLVVLASHSQGRRHWAALAALAVTIASAWWIARQADLAGFGIGLVVVLAFAGVVVLLAHDRLVGHRSSAAQADRDRPMQVDGAFLVRDLLTPWAFYDRLTRARPITTLAVLIMVILFLRGLFAFLNWREGIFVGGERIALSLLFVPLTLIAFAPMMSSVWRGRLSVGTIQDGSSSGWLRLWTAAIPAFLLNVGLALGVLVASGIARDNGFAIFALPVILASVIVAQNARRTGRQRLVDGAVALAAALTIILVADQLLSNDWRVWPLTGEEWKLWPLAPLAFLIGGLLLVFRHQALWLAPAAATAAMLLVVNLPFELSPPRNTSTDLASALSFEDNDLRLLAALNPQRLSDVGTRNAEGLEDTLIHLRSYGNTLLGRGYFNLPDPTVLRPYHLTDNAAAVHLVSPFGRVGAAAFLAVTAALAFSACWAATRRPNPAPSAWVGVLAALTLSSISIYIVLANLLAAPFTGRNVYFLAPWSMADFIEGLMLVSLVLLTLSRTQEAADG